MSFLLADSFQTSLDKLSIEEKKAAKLAAFELQITPSIQACSAIVSSTSKTKTSGLPVPAERSGWSSTGSRAA
jgi:ABC-type cobalamin transport system ATPase subunit